jgi:hypothetical protein
MSEILTDKDIINRVWDIENIKALMHKRVYFIAGDLRREELDKLWVSGEKAQESASFGSNWGWHVGMDAIRKHYADEHEQRLTLQMQETGASVMNQGNLYMHPASTGLVELAGNGETARGMWYAISQETKATKKGKAEARWILEKIAVDFLKEPDGWKIWHIVIAYDLHCLAGEDYSSQPVYTDWDTDPLRLEFGMPSIERLIHDQTFNWWDNYPPIPEPYEIFTDETSYGPEGFRPSATRTFGAGEGRNYR